MGEIKTRDFADLLTSSSFQAGKATEQAQEPTTSPAGLKGRLAPSAVRSGGSRSVPASLVFQRQAMPETEAVRAEAARRPKRQHAWQVPPEAPIDEVDFEAQEAMDPETLELERSIAIKKQAAAKALQRLQEVMAMPLCEVSVLRERPRANGNLPHHWRGLSIEDGGPVAPSAIFRKVKIPVQTPPLSRRSTRLDRRALEPVEDRKGKGRACEEAETVEAERSRPRQPNEDADDADNDDDDDDDDLVSPMAPWQSGQLPWAERRSRSQRSEPGMAAQVRRNHSRKGSMVSATSGTSGYSIPHHMIPARGSSMRDSFDGSVDDVGGSSRLSGGDSYWH
jgi:hypothetical protein